MLNALEGSVFVVALAPMVVPIGGCNILVSVVTKVASTVPWRFETSSEGVFNKRAQYLLLQGQRRLVIEFVE